MPQAIDRKGQVLVDLEIAIEKEQALDEECADKEDDQPRGHARSVIGIAHIETIGQAHDSGMLATSARVFNSGHY